MKFVQSSQRLSGILLSKDLHLPKFWHRQTIHFESTVLCINVSMHTSFQVYSRVKIKEIMFWCMLPALKVFCMEKSAQDLALNPALYETFKVKCMTMPKLGQMQVVRK